MPETTGKKVKIDIIWAMRNSLSPEDRRSIAMSLKKNNMDLPEVNKFAADKTDLKKWNEQISLRQDMCETEDDKEILDSIKKEAIEDIAISALLKFDRDRHFDAYWCQGLDDPFCARFS